MSPLPVIGSILAWVAFLFAMPVLWMRSVPLALLAVLTAGGYLAVGLGYYRHELHHNYFRPFSRQLYHLTSLLLFSDPQIFRIAHPLHHGAVHTVDDIEFYCQDYRTNPVLRRWQFAMELLFGNAAWEFHTWLRLRREGKYDKVEGHIWFLLRAALMIGLGTASERLVPGSFYPFLICYGLTLWWGAVVSRHNQWLEHAGILSEGPYEERNRLTRNLSNDGVLNKLWNFYHRNDPREHVNHHVKAGINSRLVPSSLPEGAVVTNVTEYPGILLAYWRSL